jgi:hypothetical protein
MRSNTRSDVWWLPYQAMTCAPVAAEPGEFGPAKNAIATSTPASTPDAGAHLLSHADM